MRRTIYLAITFTAVVALSYTQMPVAAPDRTAIAKEILFTLEKQLLNIWYPRSIDSVHGGFITTYSYDFKPVGDQDKMIVSQSRHTWVNAEASIDFPNVSIYKPAADHGARFLREKMWDKNSGGFFTLVNRQGQPKNPDAGKEAYGNAFGIYALAAHHKATGDTASLALAIKAFRWLERYSHDPQYNGYFQHLTGDGKIIRRTGETPSTSDLGYKDQNSSIHLLEAFTELYGVWKDPLLRERLHEMLRIIRDTITTGKGYLTLYLTADWKPVSFVDSAKKSYEQHHRLDHVSFGHDVETAYLLIEASHTLGIHNDSVTIRKAKQMVDHALMNGWDRSVGGFYDEGYYFKGDNKISITHDTKNWWAQVEGLNTLLLMSDLFPNDRMQYYEKFVRQWDYCKKYLIDSKYGDFYEAGLDKSPEAKTRNKGHIWKATYHQYRGLRNCWKRLMAK